MSVISQEIAWNNFLSTCFCFGVVLFLVGALHAAALAGWAIFKRCRPDVSDSWLPELLYFPQIEIQVLMFGMCGVVTAASRLLNAASVYGKIEVARLAGCVLAS